MSEALDPRIGKLIDKKIAPLKREISALNKALDDMEDAAAIRIIENAPDEERFPADVAKRLVAGDNPVAVFRAYRGMTQDALAEAAGTSTQYISQIERGARNPGRMLLTALAEALGVDEEDLR